MFLDDRGRLERIGEWLESIEEGIDSSNILAAEVLWYRLSRIEQSCAALSQAYLDAHPQIAALGLPTFDHALSGPQPLAAQTEALARRTLAVFKPLLLDLPPSPAPREARSTTSSRCDETVETLRRLEPYLRAQGIVALYLFGSVARREDGPESDVDLLFDVNLKSERSFTLLNQARLARELSEAFGVRVDLLERQMLHHDMADRVARDAVRVFDHVEVVEAVPCTSSRSTEDGSSAQRMPRGHDLKGSRD